MLKIGYGYDVHRLVANRKLILGGVKIPFKKGLLGHSDADVLIHAVIDAILGAMALGDIGKIFPDSDKKYEDIDSRILLRKVFALMKKNKFTLNNLDATISAQFPKLQSYILAMRENIAEDLQTKIEAISVKATTEENLGITAEGRAITAAAVVLLEK